MLESTSSAAVLRGRARATRYFGVQVVELQEELEEKNIDRAEVEAECSELRKQLLAKIECGEAIDLHSAQPLDSAGVAGAADGPERRRGRGGSREADQARPDRPSHDLDRGHLDDRTRRSGDISRSRDARTEARRSDRYRRDCGPEDSSGGIGRYARGSRNGGGEGSGDRESSRHRGRDRDRARDERSRDYERGADRNLDRDRERGDRDRKRARR